MKRSISALLAAALAAAWCAAPMCALADDASVSVQSGQTDFSARAHALGVLLVHGAVGVVFEGYALA